MNPANVPRQVPVREWTWMPLEPASQSQRAYLQDLLRRTNFDPAEMFGEGFADITGLSQWAASWAINQLKDVEIVQDAKEQRIKRLMGAVLRERMATFPVRRCATCEEDRPHRIVSAVLICEACKTVIQ